MQALKTRRCKKCDCRESIGEVYWEKYENNNIGFLCKQCRTQENGSEVLVEYRDRAIYVGYVFEDQPLAVYVMFYVMAPFLEKALVANTSPSLAVPHRSLSCEPALRKRLSGFPSRRAHILRQDQPYSLLSSWLAN